MVGGLSRISGVRRTQSDMLCFLVFAAEFSMRRIFLIAIILGIAVIMTFSPVMAFASGSDEEYIELLTPKDNGTIYGAFTAPKQSGKVR